MILYEKKEHLSKATIYQLLYIIATLLNWMTASVAVRVPC